MTREELRDHVEFLRSQDEISYDVYSGLIDEIDTLEQEPCWIPVSERLPKCNGVYEVTMRCDGGLYGSACYFDGHDTWHNDNRINFDRPFVNDKVIAWKPQSELYKVGK